MSSSLEVSCVISGVSRKLFGDFLKKKVSDYGSTEELLKGYVCKEARGLLREGFSPEEVQQKLLPKGKTAFPIDHDHINTLGLPIKRKKEVKPISSVPYKKVEIVQHTTLQAWVEWTTSPGLERGGTCVRPDIRTDNKGFCDGCEFFQYCKVTGKKMMR